jgi:hypothetical protein
MMNLFNNKNQTEDNMDVINREIRSIFNSAEKLPDRLLHKARKILRNNFFITLLIAVIIPLISIIAAAPSMGQTVQWTRTYGGFGNDAPSSIEQTADGGFIISGLTYSYGAGQDDAYIIKTDPDGYAEWIKVYGGSDKDWIQSIKQTEDGGYIATGVTYSIGAGSSDLWLLRLDTNGDTLWTKTYGGSSIEYGTQLLISENGGFFIVGFTHTWGEGYADSYVLKTDANGDTLWTKIFGGFNSDPLYSVKQLDDGGYIMLGWTYSFGHGETDYWLIRMDANGDTLWTKAYGANYLDVGLSIQEAGDGGFFLGGYESYRADHTKDFLVMKVDENGELLWEKNYGGAKSEIVTTGNGLTTTPDGGFVIVGWTSSYVDTICGYYVVRADANGDTLWTGVYSGEYEDEAAAVITTSDGGLAVVGYSFSFGSGGADIWLLKLTDEYTAIEKTEPTPNSFSVINNYPNPFNASTKLNFSCPGNSLVNINIYNITGQLVKSFAPSIYTAGNHSVTWNSLDNDGHEVSSGVYLYEIQAGEYRQVERMLLVK